MNFKYVLKSTVTPKPTISKSLNDLTFKNKLNIVLKEKIGDIKDYHLYILLIVVAIAFYIYLSWRFF